MDYESAKDLTREKFANPMPGDRFQEMFSFWVIVLYVTDEGGVMTWAYSGHGSAWKGGEIKFHPSLDAFAEWYHYKSKTLDSYTVLYCDTVGSDFVRNILVESGREQSA